MGGKSSFEKKQKNRKWKSSHPQISFVLVLVCTLYIGLWMSPCTGSKLSRSPHEVRLASSHPGLCPPPTARLSLPMSLSSTPKNNSPNARVYETKTPVETARVCDASRAPKLNQKHVNRYQDAVGRTNDTGPVPSVSTTPCPMNNPMLI